LQSQEAKIKQIHRTRDYWFAVSYILLIYISLPLMPDLWIRLTKYAGSFTNWFAAFVLLLFGLFIIFYLLTQQKGVRNFVWLGVLSLCYAWGLSRLELAVERVHFVEYGLLSVFIFRALRHKIKGKLIYFWTGSSVFCLGWLDEAIQYILPNRVYDTRDVIVNGVAGILGLLLIGLCFQPELKS